MKFIGLFLAVIGCFALVHAGVDRLTATLEDPEEWFGYYIDESNTKFAVYWNFTVANEIDFMLVYDCPNECWLGNGYRTRASGGGVGMGKMDLTMAVYRTAEINDVLINDYHATQNEEPTLDTDNSGANNIIESLAFQQPGEQMGELTNVIKFIRPLTGVDGNNVDGDVIDGESVMVWASGPMNLDNFEKHNVKGSIANFNFYTPGKLEIVNSDGTGFNIDGSDPSDFGPVAIVALAAGGVFLLAALFFVFSTRNAMSSGARASSSGEAGKPEKVASEE